MLPIPAVAGINHVMMTPRQRVRTAAPPKVARSVLPTPVVSPQIPPQIQQKNPMFQQTETKDDIDPAIIKKRFPRPVTPAREIDLPEPEMYTDAVTGQYGIRCVCGKQIDDGFMIQCENCNYWLHGLCMNIARSLPNEKFLCPFCKNKPIRCKCGNSKKYNEPIIQCVKCKYWVHKSCADLGYGRNPPLFICSFCGGGQLSVPYYRLPENQFRDFTVMIESNYAEIVEKIPKGKFRNFILADLNKGELHFTQTVARYFNAFASALFEEDEVFWNLMTSTLTEILKIDKKLLFSAIDNLAMQLLYEKVPQNRPSLFVAFNTFKTSERAQNLLEKMSIPKYDKNLHPVKLSYANGRITPTIALNDGQFICEVPGFMCHFFEANSENGIRSTYVSVPDSDFVIDTDRTSFSVSQFIKRSFHYNCHPKLFKVKGVVKALLFAHHVKSPMNTDKAKRNYAISKDEELILPFDSDLPWPTPSDEWADKEISKSTKRSSRRRKDNVEESSNTLLSVFYAGREIELPFTVISEQDMKERKEEDMIKTSSRILTRRQLHMYEKQQK